MSARVALVLVVLGTATLMTACAESAGSSLDAAGDREAAAVQAVVQRDIDSLANAVGALDTAVHGLDGTQATLRMAQQRFSDARRHYKRVEYIAAYYSPSTAELMNGPALPRVEEDEGPDIVFPPEGFQLIEEQLFPVADTAERDAIASEVQNLGELVTRLRTATRGTPLTNARVFDAMRVSVARILSLGLSGFDSPVAGLSIAEAAHALRGLRDAYEAYHASLAGRDSATASRLDTTFARAIAALEANPEFVSFDRLAFITEHANPLSRLLLTAQTALDVPVMKDVRSMRASAATMFDRDAFDPMGFAAPNATRTTAAHAALGRALFFEPRLSGAGSRSCASCHDPDRAFTDGRARSTALAGRSAVLRNAPTIINAGLQAGSFADLRTAYLEDQVTAVVGNPDEMHGSVEGAARVLSGDAKYASAFGAAFGARGDSTVTGARLQVAIAAYVRSLSRLDSRFDRHARGDSAMLSAEERLGFNLFMGKAKCATCHFPPLFNGSVPPAYQETDVEVIGVPADERGSRIDPDLGRETVTRARQQRHAFKTPTVRNVELTAPYMHNGVFRTLEQVVDFYDRGGGAGLGLKLPNQTLPADSLGLTPRERRAIVAFMRTLTDTASTTARPTHP